MVLVPNFGVRSTISNTTQIHPQQFRNFMRVYWECAWCQFQILVLEPPYQTLHKYTHSSSETSCVCTGNVHGASDKFWSQNHHIENYTKTLTARQKLHACVLGMCMVLVPNLVLEPPYSTLHKYARSSSETSCISTENVRGASAKFRSQTHHIQHYTKTPSTLQKLHACSQGMCMVLVLNFGLRTTISKTTKIHPQTLQKLQVCAHGMCMVLVPNFVLRITISNTTQIHLKQFRNFMRVHQECAWCQCQILVLEPPYSTLHKNAHRHFRNFRCVHMECAWCQYQNLFLESPYPTLHKYTQSNSETSCVCTRNVHGASAKFRTQNHHMEHYTNTRTTVQ